MAAQCHAWPSCPLQHGGRVPLWAGWEWSCRFVVLVGRFAWVSLPLNCALGMATVERLYRLKRKFDLDPDTLHCPICTEALSPPVFQVTHLGLWVLNISFPFWYLRFVLIWKIEVCCRGCCFTKFLFLFWAFGQCWKHLSKQVRGRNVRFSGGVDVILTWVVMFAFWVLNLTSVFGFLIPERYIALKMRFCCKGCSFTEFCCCSCLWVVLVSLPTFPIGLKCLLGLLVLSTWCNGGHVFRGCRLAREVSIW